MGTLSHPVPCPLLPSSRVFLEACAHPTGLSVSRPCLSVVGKGCVSGTHVQVQEPAVRILGPEPLTASMLAAAPLHQQKQMIGEWLVPLLGVGRGGLRAD